MAFKLPSLVSFKVTAVVVSIAIAIITSLYIALSFKNATIDTLTSDLALSRSNVTTLEKTINDSKARAPIDDKASAELVTSLGIRYKDHISILEKQYSDSFGTDVIEPEGNITIIVPNDSPSLDKANKAAIEALWSTFCLDNNNVSLCPEDNKQLKNKG